MPLEYTTIETERLVLRDWKESDLNLLIKMNADKKVMRYFIKALTEKESIEFYQKNREEIKINGYGIFAVELKHNHEFIGFVGLRNITFDVDFKPGMEILWRLLPEYWGNSYAPEAALSCLEYAKNILKLDKIYAFTALRNTPSERVMQKIGMKRIKEFNHPLVDPKHILLKHVLYVNYFNR